MQKFLKDRLVSFQAKALIDSLKQRKIILRCLKLFSFKTQNPTNICLNSDTKYTPSSEAGHYHLRYQSSLSERRKNY